MKILFLYICVCVCVSIVWILFFTRQNSHVCHKIICILHIFFSPFLYVLIADRFLDGAGHHTNCSFFIDANKKKKKRKNNHKKKLNIFVHLENVVHVCLLTSLRQVSPVFNFLFSKRLNPSSATRYEYIPLVEFRIFFFYSGNHHPFILLFYMHHIVF